MIYFNFFYCFLIVVYYIKVRDFDCENFFIVVIMFRLLGGFYWFNDDLVVGNFFLFQVYFLYYWFGIFVNGVEYYLYYFEVEIEYVGDLV